MSTLNNYTTATRPAHAIGLCIFNTDTKAIEVSDGTNWSIYDYDSSTVASVTNNLSAVFDGATDKLGCGNSTSLMPTGGLTISCWVKLANSSVFSTLVQRQTVSSNGYSVVLNNGSFTFYGTGAHTFGSGFTSTTDWYHVCVTHDNSNVKGYIDGNLIGTSSTTSLVSNTVSTKLGNHSSAGVSPLNGKLDEVSIFSSALDASNIVQIYNSGNPIDLKLNQGNYNSSSDLVGYWRMGDGASDTSSGGGSPASGNVIGTVFNLGSGTGNATVTGGSPEYINDAP
jgi:hypothetical protein